MAAGSNWKRKFNSPNSVLALFKAELRASVFVGALMHALILYNP
jgi:hypothetical protein